MISEKVVSMIGKAPERAEDPECRYDPNDPSAVEETHGCRKRSCGDSRRMLRMAADMYSS
jgi:hypothetical protein